MKHSKLVSGADTKVRANNTGAGQNPNKVSSVETKRKSEHKLSRLEMGGTYTGKDMWERAIDGVEHFGKPQVQHTSKKRGF